MLVNVDAVAGVKVITEDEFYEHKKCSSSLPTTKNTLMNAHDFNAKHDTQQKM